ncbi:helix-turn-helix domain-containing protein [Mesorhizobium sp. IMUNJ 23033]|uniref:helix-turn-helix domain-containing protein n=1 Tax=Mesorhizobium sp. IMUNJ 23033 TaxID=3378039 RepID=UPI00384F4E9B
MARGVKFGRKPKLSQQQRREALASLATGEAMRAVAERYNVSKSTISRLYPAES